MVEIIDAIVFTFVFVILDNLLYYIYSKKIEFMYIL